MKEKEVSRQRKEIPMKETEREMMRKRVKSVGDGGGAKGGNR